MAQTQQMMRAAAIDEFGGEISSHMLPLPLIEDDEILIRVESAGVGVWDPFEREGGFAKILGTSPQFPYVLGTDGAGTVMEVGSQVSDFKRGDKAYALALANPKGGFYAQYVAVKAKDASRIPGDLTVEQAGVLPVDGITALCGLDDVLQLRPGESILIFGASGGIGHLAVQLAKRMGARVLAVASGEDGVALARQCGADLVIEGHKSDLLSIAKQFAPNGLDAALLTAGGDAAQQALTALRPGGRAAYPNGVQLNPNAPASIQIKNYDGEPTPQHIKKLNALIEQGPFIIHISRSFPLEKATEAHAALHKHFLGKLALKPN